MNTNRLLIVLGLGAVAWWLYERQRGLSFTGEPINPMLAPSAAGRLSLVTPSTSTGTAATNVFGAISNALRTVLTSLHAAPGNGPTAAAPSSSGISQTDVRRWGLAIPPDESGPPVASQYLAPDYSLDELRPFWSMGYGYVSPVPSMPWTLNPATLGFDPNYIPPPPGT